jgi:hypothetical protein
VVRKKDREETEPDHAKTLAHVHSAPKLGLLLKVENVALNRSSVALADTSG